MKPEKARFKLIIRHYKRYPEYVLMTDSELGVISGAELALFDQNPKENAKLGLTYEVSEFEI